jgi:hypothetical protein
MGVDVCSRDKAPFRKGMKRGARYGRGLQEGCSLTRKEIHLWNTYHMPSFFLNHGIPQTTKQERPIPMGK